MCIIRVLVLICLVQSAYAQVRFVDIASRSGVDFVHYTGASGHKYLPETMGAGLAFFDYDSDGDLDMYIANDTTRNFLYRNAGGLFAEIGEFAGAAYNGDARPEAGMGVAVSDVEGDGAFDIFVTNFELETNTLYQYEGSDFFADGTFAAGLGEPGLARLGFGALFLDYDNDGDEDLWLMATFRPICACTTAPSARTNPTSSSPTTAMGGSPMSPPWQALIFACR